MNKFVFLSFIFMGWVFFELSGGTDFKPPVKPALTETASIPLAKPKPVEPIEIATTAVTRPAKPLPEVVTTVSSKLPKPGSRAPDLVDLTKTPPVTLVSLEQGGVGFGGLLDEFDPNAVRLSVAVTDRTFEPEPEPSAEPELPPADLRTVSGTRVNMRNGPGTIYDVVARLALGDEVEVLDDSGTGWLRLRRVSDRTVGWISASLVSKPVR